MWVDEASSVDISHITRFFTNQQYDKESGLYYYNARYYDPHLGSFITPDPAMDGLNHYAYCSANPIKYTDPTGLELEDGEEEFLDGPGIGPPDSVSGDRNGDGVVRPWEEWANKWDDNKTRRETQERIRENERNGLYVDFSAKTAFQQALFNSIFGPKNNQDIESQNINYHDQRGDINAPTNLYCVYDTAWNAYKTMYNLNHKDPLTEEQAKLARSNAVNNGVRANGFVYNYDLLAKSFNETFGTNYKYSYSEFYSPTVPDDLYPKFYSDGVDMPHVRYDHDGYAHTTNSLGNQTVHDVWHDRVEPLGGPVTPSTRGYDERYGTGSYRYGYHSYRL